MTDRRGEITAHFIAHWGVPSEIRPRGVNQIEAPFAILEFPPRGERSTWRYATNGMSSYAQCYLDKKLELRTELYACSANKIAWIDDLLTALAGYPKINSTYFAEGDTVSVEQPIDRGTSCFTGVLLAPPGPFDAASVGLISNNGKILVHQVLGLLSGELEYSKIHGGTQLAKLLMEAETILIDEARKQII